MRTRLAISLLTGVLLAGMLESTYAKSGNTGLNPIAGDTYYTEMPIYLPYPQQGKSWPFKQVGPIGIGINLEKPGFTMKITQVYPDSPAAATGKLKKGQVIESINGKTLKGIDPRVLLGRWIAEAEAKDGLLRLKIKDAGDVDVKIPVMGRYSKTWPRNCPKSDKIVRNLADLIGKQEKPRWGSMLFLLSTGEEKDVAVIRKWIDNETITGIGSYPWHKGMFGTGLCEYYLRTGDARVLPMIEKGAKELKAMIYNGGWSGRGNAAFTYSVGSGQLHAAGVHCLTYLLLARQCGVDVVDDTMLETLTRFYRYAGRGNVPYGDGRPEGGYRDNGKTGALGVAMQAAVGLTPEGEDSVYARARDISSIKSFYATSWFNRAHTGGGIGELWHSVAMQEVADSYPGHHRSFMDERQWHYDLSRRPDGSIGISDGAGYNSSATEHERDWGTFMALTYTAHRKKLRMLGAPATKWCKSYKLPSRPWGTAADDVFFSMTPAAYKGKVADLSGETIREEASAAAARKYNDPEASDDLLMHYVHHRDHGMRVAAARTIVNQGRSHLVLPMLQSSDPRVRQAGLLTITGMFKGRGFPDEQLTPEIFAEVEKMVNNPAESWWVLQSATSAMGRAEPGMVLRNVDRLLELAQHEDWWVQTGAIKGLQRIATTKPHHKKILPVVIEVQSRYTSTQSLGSSGALLKQIQGADPEVKAFAAPLYVKAFESIPPNLLGSGGHVISRGASTVRKFFGSAVTKVSGEKAPGRTRPMMTALWRVTNKDADLYRYDGKFMPNAAVVGKWKAVGKAADSAGIKEYFRKKAEEIEKKRKAEEAAKRKAAALKKQGKKPPKKKPAPKKKKAKPDILDIQANGTVGGSAMNFWSGDYVVKVIEGEALRMKPFNVGGQQYLAVDAGGYDAGGQLIGKKMGYKIYEKMK